MVVFISMEKLHVLAYSGHLQVLTIFLLKEFYIICLNRVVMLDLIIILGAIVKLNWWDVNGFVGSSVWMWI